MRAESGHRPRESPEVLHRAWAGAVPPRRARSGPRLDALGVSQRRALRARCHCACGDKLCPSALPFVRRSRGRLRVALRPDGGRAGRSPPARHLRKRRTLRPLLRPERRQPLDGRLRGRGPLFRRGNGTPAAADSVPVHWPAPARPEQHTRLRLRGHSLHAHRARSGCTAYEARGLRGRVLRTRALHSRGQQLCTATLHGLRRARRWLRLALRPRSGCASRRAHARRLRRR